MSDTSSEVLQRLDTLIEKVELLTSVTIIGMQKEKLLKGKNKTEQIKTLVKQGLPNDLIALIVGTTSSTVGVRRSEIKRREKRKSKQEKKIKQSKAGQTVE